MHLAASDDNATIEALADTSSETRDAVFRVVCHQVSVKSDGHDNICLNAGNEDFFAPLLASIRTLQSWERVATDFSK